MTLIIIKINGNPKFEFFFKYTQASQSWALAMISSLTSSWDQKLNHPKLNREFTKWMYQNQNKLYIGFDGLGEESQCQDPPKGDFTKFNTKKDFHPST